MESTGKSGGLTATDKAIRESRIEWRRKLVHEMTRDMALRPSMGKTELANPAADVEDFANAVAERLWAREDAEMEKW